MSSIALCIPAYNAQNCLGDLLESALKQDILFDEILVYDDCSVDNTREIALKFGVTILQGKTNQGCSFGKNELAKASKSDWLHFHDADDLLLPNFTNEMHRWIDNESANFDVLVLNFEYREFINKKLLGTANHNKILLSENPLKYVISNKIVNFGLYRRNSFLAAGGFDLDPNVLYNEDNAFHINLAKNGLRFDYLSTITCINYRHEQSMSNSNELKCAMANFHVLEKIAKSHGSLYPVEISDQLWSCISSLSVFENWVYIKKALALSKSLGFPNSTNGNRLFNFLTKINPFFSVWLREKTIRIFKPNLR